MCIRQICISDLCGLLIPRKKPSFSLLHWTRVSNGLVRAQPFVCCNTYLTRKRPSDLWSQRFPTSILSQDLRWLLLEEGRGMYFETSERVLQQKSQSGVWDGRVAYDSSASWTPRQSSPRLPPTTVAKPTKMGPHTSSVIRKVFFAFSRSSTGYQAKSYSLAYYFVEIVNEFHATLHWACIHLPF